MLYTSLSNFNGVILLILYNPKIIFYNNYYIAMALPWHIPLEYAVELQNSEVPIQASLSQHFCSIGIHDSPIEELQTGIMCDIGIHNKEPATVQRLIAAGMTVARLTTSEMDLDSSNQVIQSIRQAVFNYSAELDYVYPLAVVMNIRGPEISTGDLRGGQNSTVEILQNSTLRLTNDIGWRESGNADCLYVGWDSLTDLKAGDVIFIDSLCAEKIKLIVCDVGEDTVECTVFNGGIIRSKMPVYISQVPRDIQQRQRGDNSDTSISSSDSSSQKFGDIGQQIGWAIGSDIDGLLVPNTRNIYDIILIRDLLQEQGKHILIFACIENIAGLDNIDNIINQADGIYFDRAALSADLEIEKIFIAQKVLLAKCNASRKPVICQAIVNEQIPTLCVSDLANTVLDGADVISLELHYDSPLKKISAIYDVISMAENSAAAAAVICKQAERIKWRPSEVTATPLPKELNPTKSVCIGAITMSLRSRSKAIICLTNSGRTAKELCHLNPPCPIIAVTRICYVSRQLRFWKGVRALHYFEVAKTEWSDEVETRIRAALDYCKAKLILKAGDPYVVLSPTRRGGGYCDSARLFYASARDTIEVC